MPPKEKLADADAALLTAWIARGLPGLEAAAPVAVAEKSPITAEQRKWWSFHPSAPWNRRRRRRRLVEDGDRPLRARGG
jgi:hypothetical protein